MQYTSRMIEYVVPGNTDRRIIERAARTLADGGLVALPTDTSWIVACSLGSKQGIARLRALSGERDERRFTLLCSRIAQAGEYCSLDNTRFRLVKRLVPGPYVFILRALLGTEKALDIRRKEVGVRIPDHPVAAEVVEALGAPLYSVTAKKSMAGGEAEADDERSDFYGIPEEDLFEGGWELEAIEGIDLILDDGAEKPRLLSTVLDLTGDEAVLLRAGAGPWEA